MFPFVVKDFEHAAKGQGQRMVPSLPRVGRERGTVMSTFLQYEAAEASILLSAWASPVAAAFLAAVAEVVADDDVVADDAVASASVLASAIALDFCWIEYVGEERATAASLAPSTVVRASDWHRSRVDVGEEEEEEEEGEIPPSQRNFLPLSKICPVSALLSVTARARGAKPVTREEGEGEPDPTELLE